VARMVQPDAAGSAITLETSEPLFYLATALNVCGYDRGLADSNPLRKRVRDEINDDLASNAGARDARDALCLFIREHALTDSARDVAQYISLGLYLTPVPELALSADKSDLPPDATEVADILPLLRQFAETIQLNAIWAAHRPEYEAMITRIHDPMTAMVLNTNIFLRMPVSSYDGRRFMVLLEPMLAPAETNARYNGIDSVIVVSPRALSSSTNGAEATGKSGDVKPDDEVPMDLIRHTYLHYTVEPLVYTRTTAMERLSPLLKLAQKAPIEYAYRSSIGALLTECLIKAIEAHTMDVGIAVPVKPAGLHDRYQLEQFDAQMSDYDRRAEAVRRTRVDLDMRQGWLLTDYFYGELSRMEKDGTGLKEFIGQMIYGMDVDSERHREEKIVFLPEGSDGSHEYGDSLRRAPRPLTQTEQAERGLMRGDVEGAETLAEAALKSDPGNAKAEYLLGRIDLMEGDPDGAQKHLSETIKLSHDPRTIAWAHIYLGRMYDIERDPDDPTAIKPQRENAIAEYRAALANRDSQPDTKEAAERGIKQPFTLPRRASSSPDERKSAPTDDAPLAPTGEAGKVASKPTP